MPFCARDERAVHEADFVLDGDHGGRMCGAGGPGGLLWVADGENALDVDLRGQVLVPHPSLCAADLIDFAAFDRNGRPSLFSVAPGIVSGIQLRLGTPQVS